MRVGDIFAFRTLVFDRKRNVAPKHQHERVIILRKYKQPEQPGEGAHELRTVCLTFSVAVVLTGVTLNAEFSEEQMFKVSENVNVRCELVHFQRVFAVVDNALLQQPVLTLLLIDTGRVLTISWAECARHLYQLRSSVIAIPPLCIYAIPEHSINCGTEVHTLASLIGISDS